MPEKLFSYKHNLVLLLSLIIHQLAYSQTDESRYVKGSALYSKEYPNIVIDFDKHFSLLGRQSFILFNNSTVTQFYFARLNRHKKIKALITVQFEAYLPEINQTYNYNIQDSVLIGGISFLYSPVYNEPGKVFRDTIRSDVWHRISFLKSKGYNLPDELIGYRFVKLTDRAKKREMLIIYNEDLKNSKTTASELDNDSKKTDEVMALLLKRAIRSFSIAAYK